MLCEDKTRQTRSYRCLLFKLTAYFVFLAFLNQLSVTRWDRHSPNTLSDKHYYIFEEPIPAVQKKKKKKSTVSTLITAVYICTPCRRVERMNATRLPSSATSRWMKHRGRDFISLHYLNVWTADEKWYNDTSLVFHCVQSQQITVRWMFK